MAIIENDFRFDDEEEDWDSEDQEEWDEEED